MSLATYLEGPSCLSSSCRINRKHLTFLPLALHAYGGSDGGGVSAAGVLAAGPGEVGPPRLRAEGVPLAQVRVSAQALPEGVIR